MKALNQPESWWGWHGWNHPEPLSITQVMRAGTFPPRVGAILWLAMEHGKSMVLAADPPGAGKTTILTALLAFARPDAALYFTRGWGETFQLPRISDGETVYLMVNEISDHLPVYSWGPYVQRAFELMGDGYSLLSTMHADTVDGVIEQLTEENDVPEAHIGRLTFVVPLHIGHDGQRRVRRLAEIAVLEPLGRSFDRHTIVRWRHEDDAYDILTTPAQINALARRLGVEDDEAVHEVARRERFLAGLLDAGEEGQDEVQRRIVEFGGYSVAG